MFQNLNKMLKSGFRKWILRYIADCSGEKTYSYHTYRLDKVHDHIKTGYDTVKADQNSQMDVDYQLDDKDY